MAGAHAGFTRPATSRRPGSHTTEEGPLRRSYPALWRGQQFWNGVAILAKTEPVLVRKALPGDDADTQSRYLEAAVQGVLVGCLYLPNGNPQPGPKFDFKLAWLERLIAHAATLVDSEHPVVLAGDYNVVPTDDDIYDPKSWKKDALLQPAPRAAFARLMKQGWLDAILEQHGPQGLHVLDYFRQPAHRPSAAQQNHRAGARRIRRRPLGAEPAETKRPRAGLDHARPARSHAASRSGHPRGA